MKEKQKVSRIGGQALLEGVMMQGTSAIAMSVRAPDGSVVTEVKRKKKASFWVKVPIIRGIISFVSSLITGSDSIMKSSQQAFPEDETPSKGMTVIASFVGVLLAVGLFILLPGFLSDLIRKYLFDGGVLLHALIEGVIRILLFVGYLVLVALMPDIKRTFMYHGAEHRTINCYEKGMPITVENVQKCSTRHNRCGTTFLFFVMIISILVFALVRWGVGFIPWFPQDNNFALMGVRLLFLPIIAGLSYELLRFLALLPDNWFVNIFRAPGLGLQRLTTYPPEDDMAEIAITAFTAVLAMDENPNLPEREFGEYLLPDLRAYMAGQLNKAGKDQCDADWILCEVTGYQRSQLSEMVVVNKETADRAKAMLRMRLDGTPLDYVIGKVNFYGIDIVTGEGALIPRPETELLCEQAIAVATEKSTVLDLMTGSGCIARVIKEKTGADVTASDVSENALEIARKNLDACGVTVVKSDVFSALEGKIFDLIVSNPPYIRTADIDGLQEEVKREPHLALDGGEDGMKFYKIIATESPKHLTANGTLLLEIGYDQAEQVCSLLSESFENIEVIKDLEGNDRIVKAKLKN